MQVQLKLVLLVLYSLTFGACSKKAAKKDNLKVECKLDPSPYGPLLGSQSLNIKSIWKIYNTNLLEITAGLDKIISKVENYSENDLSAFFGFSDAAQIRNGMVKIYINLLQYKLLTETMTGQNFSLAAQIPSLHLLQFLVTPFWKSTANFEIPGYEHVYESVVVKNYLGEENAEYEMDCCLKMEFVLMQCIKTAEKAILMGEGDKNVLSYKRDISILFQRILIANIALQSIRMKAAVQINFPIQRSLYQVENMAPANETSTAGMYEIPGTQYVYYQLININYSTTIVAFCLNDISQDILSHLDFLTALHTFNMMFCHDLKNFQLTGNPHTIVSRLLLQVIEKRKNTVSVIDYIVKVSSDLISKIDDLSYSEKTQKLIVDDEKASVKAPLKKISKAGPKKKQTTKKNVKKKATTKKYTKKISNVSSEKSKPSRKQKSNYEVSSSDDDMSDAIVVKSPKLDPSMHYMILGQGCYDFALYPLLTELGITYYTWKQVSEACYTSAGLRALATLNLTLSQIDVCIAAVRNRVPFAHPSMEKWNPEEIQDALLVLSYEYPEMSVSFDRLRQGLSSSSTWNVVPGQSAKLRSQVTFERSQIVSASLHVAEYCRVIVFKEAAAIIGLDTETSSISEIIANSTENLETLFDCQTAIRLRNQLAHQNVSPSEALEAARFIYAADDRSLNLSVLESFFNRVQDKRSKGGEFY